MSYAVTPFEVISKVLAGPVQVRFIHLASGIATRHSDTIDATFFAGGQQVVVAIPCATLTTLREHEHKNLTDQQLAEIAATHLRTTLEHGYDPNLAELRMTDGELRALALHLGFLR
ncbi:MAG: hypothetical protein HY508_10990 [Acidobacteria bacterium]|nr:hypothetical protein [Acidobacteriota bacterium]